MRGARFDDPLPDKQTEKFLNKLNLTEADIELGSDYDSAITYPCRRVKKTESRKTLIALSCNISPRYEETKYKSILNVATRVISVLQNLSDLKQI